MNPPSLCLGGKLVRISLPYIYSFTESLAELHKVTGGEAAVDHFYRLFGAQRAIQNFLGQSVYADALRVCRAPGTELHNQIKAMLDKQDDVLDHYDVVVMQKSLSDFRTILDAEFQTAGAYLVTVRRGYDIITLVENAEIIFSPEVVSKVPTITPDLREAGKCIAFGLGTAAGFHLVRALEIVVSAYWAHVMDGKPLPDNRNLGGYITGIEHAHKQETKRVTFALRQVKDLYRNSLIHPEESLTLDQAISLIGTVQGAMALMVNDMDVDSGRALREQSAKAEDSAFEEESESIQEENKRLRAEKSGGGRGAGRKRDIRRGNDKIIEGKPDGREGGDGAGKD